MRRSCQPQTAKLGTKRLRVAEDHAEQQNLRHTCAEREFRKALRITRTAFSSSSYYVQSRLQAAGRAKRREKRRPRR
eukprot:63097-Pleurochrysis_carterae.AAC.1